MKKKSKHVKTSNLKKKIFLYITIIIFILGIIYICYYTYSCYKNKKDNTDILDEINIDYSQIKDDVTERMLKIKELQKQNGEIMGWLEIDGTNINYPVCQGKDNDYYLKHNYKKEYSSVGSLFLDKDFDIINGSSNYLIYGHRNKQGIMFEKLINYAKKDFYENHKTIRFTTEIKDSTYEIISVFYSKVYYKNDKDVFRYYYFVSAKDEEEYNQYISNVKKLSIYDIDTTAKYGEQLLTLSTCEYSQKNGRFVVVAKEIK